MTLDLDLFWRLFVALAGPVVGSFLGAAVLRRHARESIVYGRSRCRSCGAALGAAELAPIISFIMLGGRCRHCGAAIAHVLLTAEVLGLAVGLACALASPHGRAGPDALLGWALVAVALIDLRSLRIPRGLATGLIAAGLAVAALEGGVARLAIHGAAAFAGGLAFAALAAVFAKVRGRAGLGGGDAMLLAAGGAWAGPAALAPIVAAASLMALAFAWLRARRRNRPIGRHARVPFGPFLGAAIFAARLLTG